MESTTDKGAIVRAKIESAMDALAAALEQGQSQALRDYLAFAGRFHRYSLGNQILIMLQCPTARLVAGFRSWNRFNRFVRKGEKGIAILAPMIFAKGGKASERAETGDSRTLTPERGERDTGKVVRFRVVHVFDLSQTDGDPVPEYEMGPAAGDPGEHLEALRAFVRGRGLTLEHADCLGGADGLCSREGIKILAGMAPAREFSVLAHETAHAILHWGDDAERGDKRVRELEAEAVAAAVCSGVGIDPGPSASDYIALYGGDKAALRERLHRIQKAAALILDALVAEPALEAA